MEEYFYHVTSKDNLGSILANGLKANENGDIFLYIKGSYITHFGMIVEDNKLKIGDMEVDIIDDICLNQVFLVDECLLLRINSKGLKGELIEDVVNESPSHLHKQWIVKQDVIEPKWISYALYTPKKGKMVNVREVRDVSNIKDT